MAGGSFHRPFCAPGPSSISSCSLAPPATSVPGSGGGRARRPRLRPAADAAGSSLAKSYSAGPPAISTPSASTTAPLALLSVDMSSTAFFALRNAGPAPVVTPRPIDVAMRRNDDRVAMSTPASRTATEHHDRARRRDELAGGLPDDGAEPAARALHLGRGARDLVRALGQVEQAQEGHGGQADAERQAQPVLAAPVEQERDAAGQQRDREHVAPDADERAEPGVDPGAHGPCDPQVDGQAEEDAGHHDHQADEVVAMGVERAAHRSPAGRRAGCRGMPLVGVLAGDRRVGLLDAEVRLAMAVPYQRGARTFGAPSRRRPDCADPPTSEGGRPVTLTAMSPASF